MLHITKESIQTKESILLNVAAAKNAWFVIIVFLIFGLNFNILCNVCHDFTILIVNISDISIVIVKDVDYNCVIHDISRSEANDLFKKFCIWWLLGYIKNIIRKKK